MSKQRKKYVNIVVDCRNTTILLQFDVATKPWGLEPEQLIKVLQNTPAPAHDPPKGKSDAEIIASLTTPKKSSTRYTRPFK